MGFDLNRREPRHSAILPASREQDGEMQLSARKISTITF
jgi:hypothetical protein